LSSLGLLLPHHRIWRRKVRIGGGAVTELGGRLTGEMPGRALETGGVSGEVAGEVERGKAVPETGEEPRQRELTCGLWFRVGFHLSRKNGPLAPTAFNTARLGITNQAQI
jgi:hypothetical protein